METGYLDAVRLAQRDWARTPLGKRLAVIACLRRRMASGARELAETVPARLPGALNRTVADTLGAEVLPVMEACRFLERSAARLLAPKRLGMMTRPIWLFGLDSRVERAPWGVVLLIGAGNYPLLLAGVQAIQALTAGNAVLWKPAPGTEAVAYAFRELLVESGLNPKLLTVLDSSVAAGIEAMDAGVDHVVLTGSAATGKAVLRRLAETMTPATMELSGCDAVFVLPGAELTHTVRALAFGMRLNGSCTCMAPRRVFLVGMAEADAAKFEGSLATALDWLEDVAIPRKTELLLRDLIEDARSQGAQVLLNGLEESGGIGLASPTLIVGATPALLSMRTDIFAPVLSVMRAADEGEALAASAACEYALSAAVFGPEADALELAGKVRAGGVLINDVIVPTVDPRISFGGRGRSGFGVTRGEEGLLAMTTPRTVQIQRSRLAMTYEPTGDAHIELFAGLALALHGDGVAKRWAGVKRLVGAARKLRKQLSLGGQSGKSI
jgi:acyl-CoA reductase-like NAD-dependent aldehyde dehydrogenase